MSVMQEQCTHSTVKRIKRNCWQKLFFKQVYRCSICGKVLKIRK